MQSLTQKQIDRFWGKVDKEKSNIFYNGTRCWEWTGYRNKKGYGEFSPFHVGRPRAHRISWELNYEEIPDSLFVLHHCDNPPCVNPDHLFLGTNQDNVDDMVKKGRQASGDKSGSRLHPEKVVRGDEHYSRLHPDKVARGENSGGVKLTQLQVDEIRRRYARWGIGGDTQSALAKEFGISQAEIWNIVNYKRWP